MKDSLLRALPWVAAVLIGLVAFATGRCTGGETNGGETNGGETNGGETNGGETNGGASTEEPREAETTEVWTCAMHPQIRRNGPGSCPICGMDLIPVGSSGESLGADQVALGERARALARIRTEGVGAAAASSRELRLSGRVEVDETTQRTVTSWIGGRIDRLHVRVTGESVRRGQTIATLYSPEVYAAQRDLSAASRHVERLRGASELARSTAEATLASSRERLRLLGIPRAEVTRMETASAPSQRIAIRSPFAGTVLERIATEGSYVSAGAPLYRLADLSRLWVQLDAYESDLSRLAVGQSVDLVVDAREGEPLTGRVAFVDPVIDPRRRTARVRIEVANPEHELRPGMFVEAIVRGEEAGPSRLSIPASAPLFTGRRSIVYVEVPDRAQPTYEARTVRLGERSGERYPVLEGLVAGERVVIEGAFALDADLQIRGGASMMTRDPAEAVSREVFAPVVAAYLETQEALAHDDLDGSRAAARRLATASHANEALTSTLATHAHSMMSATDLASARAAFEPLSDALIRELRSLGNPTEGALRVAFCPMAFDDRGAEWVQAAETIENPYFGAAMASCGSFRQTLPEARGSDPAPDPGSAFEPDSSRPSRSTPRPRPRRPAAPAPASDSSGNTGHVH